MPYIPKMHSHENLPIPCDFQNSDRDRLKPEAISRRNLYTFIF